jgi:hypothetical protein
VQQHEQQLQLIKQNLTRAQNKYKQAADKNKKDFEFSVGDQVLLKLQPYTQSTIANRPFPKLAFKYFGPFSVLQRIGKVAYKLDLPADSLIHPVFHISQLKPYTPNYTPVFDVLPQLTDLEAADTVSEQILEHRMIKRGNTAIPQVKIKWRGLPDSATTWEDYYVIKAQFPSAPAWRLAASEAGGIVTPGVQQSQE